MTALYDIILYVLLKASDVHSIYNLFLTFL